MSTDSQETFKRQPINVLKLMLEAESFVAQITPYNESPVTAIFEITGMPEAIADIRETCSW